MKNCIHMQCLNLMYWRTERLRMEIMSVQKRYFLILKKFTVKFKWNSAIITESKKVCNYMPFHFIRKHRSIK